MPAQWTGDLIGRMHNAGVTCKELAAELGKNEKYVSGIFNGHYAPKKAADEFNAAFNAILKKREEHTDD